MGRGLYWLILEVAALWKMIATSSVLRQSQDATSRNDRARAAHAVPALLLVQRHRPHGRGELVGFEVDGLFLVDLNPV